MRDRSRFGDLRPVLHLRAKPNMQTFYLGVIFTALTACGGGSSSKSPIDAQAPDACIPETDAELCSRIDACEAVNVPDNCGATRSVDCGACGGSDVCVANQCKASQCSSLAFPNTSLATTLNAPNVQDALAAVSAD